ncbi:DNA-directed RNA polymerase I subunit rpa49 [Orbilia oligospora]|uniref:DNA-directed RNA polymerase I subunit rpa49 n=1 Tax=Orbilia oligospora TaxID=2813651 RepID=A0A6G1MJH2_ORBOL|nr:DNA-directed RNA polymerase I subunit rpa49 [Orbilia oligospora]KAF3261114.1 DNA-directed RNA polymerase I subunit rpa49 [Orbilia oligospora]
MASPERERKRKRDAQGQPRPVVPSSSSQSQVIKINRKDVGSHPPIIASIHGVELPTDLTFSAFSKKSKVSKHMSGGTKGEARETEYCLQAQTSRIEYDGRVEGEDGLSYYVGVYDPEKGSVDVYPSPLVHVRRQVRRLKEKEIPEKASTGTLMDSRQALSAAFGNRTSRKALKDEQLNAITSSTLGSTGATSVVSAISSAVDSATALLPTSESLRTGSGNSKYLPPIHADEEGVTVDTVYRIEEMVEKKVLDGCAEGVREWEKSVRAGGEVESTISPHYVTSRIRGVIDSGANVTKRLKILRYIEHMIQFHRLFINSFSNTVYRPKLYDTFVSDDKAITSHLIDTFTDAKNQNKNERQLSKTKLTKLYCWLMILCLKVEEDGRMDLFDLVQDLQIERREVEMAAREIGARVEAFKEGYLKLMGYGKEEAREHKLVALRLPLVFPKNKMLQVRKR